MMNFGDKLRILIEDKDMTQKELAARLNISPSTVSSYVQNTREPDFATLKMLAKFFDVSIDYLLDYSAEHTATQQDIELLRVFRTLTPAQKELCIEQTKVFMKYNSREKQLKE